MYLKSTVKIPELESGISEKKIKGTTYIYYEFGHWCRGRLQEYYDCQTTAVPIVAGLSAEMLQTI